MFTGMTKMGHNGMAAVAGRAERMARNDRPRQSDIRVALMGYSANSAPGHRQEMLCLIVK